MKGKIINGLKHFFGPQKKEQTFAEKVAEAMPLIIKAIPEIRKLTRGHSDPGVEPDGKIIGEMYDFARDYDGRVTMSNEEWNALPNPAMPQEQPADARQIRKPKDVADELETIPMPWTLDDLDGKISLLQDKTLLSNQRFVTEQLEAIIKRLQNRKKYNEHRTFFESFPNTTDEKIDNLLKKYKLVIKHSELFVPTFPKEAIDIMKKYSEVTRLVSDEKPVFYVIAEYDDFSTKNKKLDPILLAQSPFGFYWQILGAWDKEMLLLHEL